MANRLAHFTTSLGNFQVELFESRAPVTTKNFRYGPVPSVNPGVERCDC